MSEEQKIGKRRTFRPRAIPGKYKNYKKEFNKTQELVDKARNIWIIATNFIFIEEKHYAVDRNWKVSRQFWISEMKN